MGSRSASAWLEQAEFRLRSSGHKEGEARRAVLELLDAQDCALSALEIEDGLRVGKKAVGRASVYRAIEQLVGLGLLQRVDRGSGAASYEKIEPSGEHHHHLVCQSCGRLVPFTDPGLERAIGRLADRAAFTVSDHDVVLRGECPRCAS